MKHSYLLAKDFYRVFRVFKAYKQVSRSGKRSMEKDQMSPRNLLLRRARDEKGWTQQDLADKLADELSDEIGEIRIDAQRIGRWERLESFPSPKARLALCKVLGKNSEELGLLWDRYHPQEPDLLQAAPETEQEEKENGSSLEQTPDLQQRDQITHKWYSRKRLLALAALLFILLVVIIGGGVLVFVPKAPASPARGSLIYTDHIPKKGSYETYINALAWSPNSSYLACAIGDHTVRILKPGTGEEGTVFFGHSNNVNSVVWLPNGRQVASASSDQTIQIWDAFTGHTLIKFSATAPVMAVTVSPDGHEIAWAGKDGITQIWSITSKEHLLTYSGQFGSGGIWGLAFSHNGKLLATGDSTGDIQILNAETGVLVLNYKKHSKVIYGLDWSPDDHYIASASGDGTVRVWSVASGETVHIQTHNGVAMQAVSWSPDGLHIASASEDGTVQIWNAFVDGNAPFVYHHHSGVVYTVAWSPDGKEIASGDANGDIQVWSAK